MNLDFSFSLNFKIIDFSSNFFYEYVDEAKKIQENWLGKRTIYRKKTQVGNTK